MMEFMTPYGQTDGEEGIILGHFSHHIAMALRTLGYLRFGRDHTDHFMPLTFPGDTMTQIHEASTFGIYRQTVINSVSYVPPQSAVGLQFLEEKLGEATANV
jgi:hypothetical protein